MKYNPCASCGFHCYSKKLRPTCDGEFEIFCRNCMQTATSENGEEKIE